MTVTGTAQLVDTSTVHFETVEQKEGGATVKGSGEVAFLDIVPVPTDLDISDWIVFGTYPKVSQNRDAQPIIPPDLAHKAAQGR